MADSPAAATVLAIFVDLLRNLFVHRSPAGGGAWLKMADSPAIELSWQSLWISQGSTDHAQEPNKGGGNLARNGGLPCCCSPETFNSGVSSSIRLCAFPQVISSDFT